ncbi:haloacid dehalogenase-like hydrolase [Planctomycetes bacterium MalM25]|nr:haloacid dehalogenase-like hydrolase [Planctomycetes bacterium MalM25]
MRRKLLLALVATLTPLAAAWGDDPLPSWRDGETKSAIFRFVARVTNEGGEDYVAPEDRVAVFDNDGTLWSEKPIYFQVQFALDRLREKETEHPEWREDPLLAAAIDGDREKLAEGGMEAVAKLVMATHAGVTTDGFDSASREWLDSAQHPRFKRRYRDLLYQPMLELLAYLRRSGFKTYIVSGGGIDFLRVFAEEAYGIPPEQVVGSVIKTEYELRDGKPTLVRLPEIDFIDDKAGKPVGIHKFIGRRPILAFGNSDGDREMLEWVAAGEGARFAGIVRHTDAEREWAYDRDSAIGRLDKALEQAGREGWTVVDMKRDWATVYPRD